MFFVIFLLLWSGLNAYVFLRLLSIPLVAHYLPPVLLIPVALVLTTSYIGARLLEHVNLDLGGTARVLEFVGANWVGIFFLLFVTFLAADIVTGFGFLVPGLAIRIRTGALVAAAVLAAIAYLQAWRAPVVTDYEVAMPGLPRAADGTVLVVASDLHMGAMIRHGWARARAAQFAALNPDLVLLVGDIFEGDLATHAAWLPVLQQFQARHGVFAVTGNHEFYAGPAAILDLFRRAGFRVLRDEHHEVVPGLILAGVDDPAFRKNGRRDQPPALDEAFANRPSGATIFLSHTPVFAEKAAQLGAGLMLCGHTHNGQIWPFQYIVRLAFRLVAGRYDVNGMTAIVGRGTGTWGPRMRLWQRSELLRITLRAPQ